jgi:hypothetical protein
MDILGADIGIAEHLARSTTFRHAFLEENGHVSVEGRRPPDE